MAMKDERLIQAKNIQATEEELFELAKVAYYNRRELGLAIANHPNATQKVMSMLVKSGFMFEEVNEAIASRKLNEQDIREVIHILDANMYDWNEEEWEKVRTALVIGESRETINKNNEFSHIITDEYPGSNPLFHELN